MTTDHETSSRCTPAPGSGTTLDELRNGQATGDAATIRSAAFMWLLERGEPVSAADLAAATGVGHERVAEILGAATARGRIEFTEDGHVAGIAGLTLTPSRHQLSIGAATRWTWCALDAVGVLGALDATGTIRSTDPQTGDTIEIDFIDGTPDTSVHLFIVGGFSEGNVRENWCPLVNFFATYEAATSWVQTHGAQGDIVAVMDIAGEAAAVWRDVVALGPKDRR